MSNNDAVIDLMNENQNLKAEIAALEQRLEAERKSRCADLDLDRAKIAELDYALDNAQLDIVSLTEERDHWKANHADMVKRIAELEAATEHLGLTPQQAKDGLIRYKAREAHIAELEAKLEAAEKSFPMQDGPAIPWKTAQIIFAGYSSLYGTNQSLDKLASRGGFGWAEVPSIYAYKHGRAAIDAAIAQQESKDE